MSNILIQVLDPDEQVKFAIVDISDEVKEYLNIRKTLLTGVRQALSTIVGDDEDLNDIRFSGFDFVSFYGNDLDISSVVPNVEEFYKTGYCLVPDDFAEDVEEMEIEYHMFVIMSKTWYVQVNTLDTSCVDTIEIPYNILEVV